MFCGSATPQPLEPASLPQLLLVGSIAMPVGRRIPTATTVHRIYAIAARNTTTTATNTISSRLRFVRINGVGSRSVPIRGRSRMR